MIFKVFLKLELVELFQILFNHINSLPFQIKKIHIYHDTPDTHRQTWIKITSTLKSATVSTVSPSICHEVMGLDAMILVF